MVHRDEVPGLEHRETRGTRLKSYGPGLSDQGEHASDEYHGSHYYLQRIMNFLKEQVKPSVG